jgi:hypothetical protein
LPTINSFLHNTSNVGSVQCYIFIFLDLSFNNYANAMKWNDRKILDNKKIRESC